jgi:hypothetical protein
MQCSDNCLERETLPEKYPIVGHNRAVYNVLNARALFGNGFENSAGCCSPAFCFCKQHLVIAEENREGSLLAVCAITF